MPQTDDGTAWALAEELVKIRKRSLAAIDLNTRAQPRLDLPRLEAVARQHTGRSDLLRMEQIRRLLHDGLAAYTAVGHTDAATLITDLFFDDGSGERVSRRSGGQLLQAAESRYGPINFEKRRREEIRLFAAFLIDFVEPPIDQAADSNPKPPASELEPEPQLDSEPQLNPDSELDPMPDARTPRRWLTKTNVFMTIALLYIGGFLAIDGIGELMHKDPFGLRPAKKTPLPPSQSAAIKLDDLGGEAGLIKTYAGVHSTPTDLLLVDAYKTGAAATVTCKATGRSIGSDNDHGEAQRQSNIWLKLDTKSGPQQYVSTVYADISDSALNALQACPDAP